MLRTNPRKGVLMTMATRCHNVGVCMGANVYILWLEMVVMMMMTMVQTLSLGWMIMTFCICAFRVIIYESDGLLTFTWMFILPGQTGVTKLWT